jgi:hypothetical protein
MHSKFFTQLIGKKLRMERELLLHSRKLTELFDACPSTTVLIHLFMQFASTRDHTHTNNSVPYL